MDIGEFSIYISIYRYLSSFIIAAYSPMFKWNILFSWFSCKNYCFQAIVRLRYWKILFNSPEWCSILKGFSRLVELGVLLIMKGFLRFQLTSFNFIWNTLCSY